MFCPNLKFDTSVAVLVALPIVAAGVVVTVHKPLWSASMVFACKLTLPPHTSVLVAFIDGILGVKLV